MEKMMTVELWMLLGVVLLFFIINILQAILGLPTIGIINGLGNRENDPVPMPGIAGRAQRTVRNHVEGLVVFAPLVLVAAQIGVTNGLTVLGAQLFFYGRVAHAFLYIAGIKYMRSLAFLVGVIGLFVFAKGAFF
jgi:uncharacterized MAPEG superfamily protein